MVFPLAAALIGGGSLLSGLFGSSAAKSAANTQADATNRAADLQNQQFQELLRLQMPAYNRGEQAAGVYGAALGLPSMTGGGGGSGGGSPGMMTGGRDWSSYLNQNPDVRTAIDGGGFGGAGDPYGAAERHYQEYGQREGRASPAYVTAQQQIAQQVQNTPGYQAQLDAGIKSIDRAAPLTGGMYSGRRMKALEGYGQNTFGSYYQNWMDRVGGVAGQGQQTAQNVGQAGMQNAQNVGGLMVQGANARAQGQVSSANAWSGAIGTGIGAYGGSQGWFGR